jgi:hypothetical protein
MATKRPQGAAAKAAEASVDASPKQPPTRPRRAASASPTPASGLYPSDTPGAYLNDRGVLCDERGIALDFLQLKTLDRARLGAVIDDAVDSPAKYLKAVALDPRMSTAVRIDAAKAAAPYFDRKTPVSVDGGLGDDGAVQPVNMALLASMPKAELEAALAVLAKLGFSV